MLYKKITWRKITNEALQPGDFWASHDPNEVERQGEGKYGNGPNIQLQAVGQSRWGKNPSLNDPHTNLGNGAYWRPTGLVEMRLVPQPVETAELAAA